MNRLAEIVTLMLLAACSKDVSMPSEASSDTLPATKTHAASAETSPTSSQAAGSNLTGQMSKLHADVSGLSMRTTGLGTVIDLPADALFAYDKTELTGSAEVELRKAADIIRRLPGEGQIQIFGHSDNLGSEAYNLRLSRSRATTVAEWFNRQVGVRKRSFSVIGKGETEPLVPNQSAEGKDDPAGRARNRRVEIIIPKN